MGQRPREVGRRDWAPGLSWDWNGRITQHAHKYTVREATQGNGAAKTSTLFLLLSIQLSTTCTLPRAGTVATNHTPRSLQFFVFFYFFLATPALMVPVIFFSFESLHLCLKGVPASLNAAAGKTDYRYVFGFLSMLHGALWFFVNLWMWNTSDVIHRVGCDFLLNTGCGCKTLARG